MLGFWLVQRIANIDESTIQFRKKYSNNLTSFIHGYVYGRFQHAYLTIVNFIGDLFLKVGVDDSPAHTYLKNTHHFKVITPEEAKKLIIIDKPVNITNTERVVPFNEAKDIILEHPIDIALLACACRSVNNHGCQAEDSCLYLGKPLVDFVVNHGKYGARRISQEEAIEVLEKSREEGRITTAGFKDAFGDRLYSICNCCSCCCLGMKAYREHGIPLIASSGYVSIVDSDLCNNCGNCLEVCFFTAITEKNGQIIINHESCLGCGLCQETCPQNAIKLFIDETKPEPLSTLLK